MNSIHHFIRYILYMNVSLVDRAFSSIGYERHHNAMLPINTRKEFIDKKCKENLELPPYFEHMKSLNLCGTAATAWNLTATPLVMEAFQQHHSEALMLDVRGVSAFMGAHIPLSVAMPELWYRLLQAGSLIIQKTLSLLQIINRSADGRRHPMSFHIKKPSMWPVLMTG